MSTLEDREWDAYQDRCSGPVPAPWEQDPAASASGELDS